MAGPDPVKSDSDQPSLTFSDMFMTTIRQRIVRAISFGRPIPSAAERAIEREALQRRIRQGPLRFDDVRRLNALDDLDGQWGCKPLRVLLYKLRSDDD